MPTNQRAELTAIGIALKIVFQREKELTGTPWFDVEIYSDSRYAIGCMTEWREKWKANGWRNADGAPVGN